MSWSTCWASACRAEGSLTELAPSMALDLHVLHVDHQLRTDSARDAAFVNGAVGNVLEIGPGEGAVACRLAPGRSYTGVELSDRTRVRPTT